MSIAQKLLLVVLCISLNSFVYSTEWYESHVIILESLSDISPNPNDLATYFAVDAPTREKQLELALIENKKYVLELYSLVLYGYNFLYVPSDNLRNITENWTLEPIAQILPDDVQLHEVDRQVYDAQLSIIYRYDLQDSQIKWLKGWESIDVLPSGGIGVALASGLGDVAAKTKALQDAIKGAVRDRLRKQIPTKPLEVRGLVKLAKQPFVYRSGEYYNAKVKVQIKINTVKEQQLF